MDAISPERLQQIVAGLAAFLRTDLALAKRPDRIVSSSAGSARVEYIMGIEWG